MKILKYIGIVGSICSILGFGIVDFLSLNKDILYFIIFGIILFAICFSTYYFLENKETQKLFDDCLEQYHCIFHDIRQPINKLYLAIINKKKVETGFFKEYLLKVLSHVKRIFDDITKDDCAVTLKLLNPEHGNIVTTFLRDHLSEGKRKGFKDLENYNVSENTAFNKICTETGTTIFSENDLTKLESEGHYKNIRQNWKELYNATIVAPIQFQQKIDNKDIIIIFGFLCIDNFEGGFKTKRAKDAIAIVSDALYNLFNLYNQYDVMIKKKKKKGAKNE